MENIKLTWDEIKEKFDKEWIELVDYDWPETEIYPQSGTVRVHAKTRSEFDDLADRDPPIDSAYVYVGQAEKSNDVVLTRGYSRVQVGTDNN